MAALPAVAQTRISARDLRGVKMPAGRIVIHNDNRSISATQSVGEISRALFTLRSTSSLSYHPYGDVVYQSGADVTGPIGDRYGLFIREAATRHGVDPRLIAAVAMRESGGDPNSVSRVGAQGLIQLMPATAKFLGVTDVLDIRENILAGTHYLRMLLDTFHGDLGLTLAAYNAGPGAVERYRGVPPYRETINYVSAVRSTYERAIQR